MRAFVHCRFGLLAIVVSPAVFAGCSGSDSPSIEPAADGPTYHQDVAPLLAKHCQTCHSEGNIAPFSLISYDDAQRFAGLIKEQVRTRRMPPWHVQDDGSCQTFRESPRLSDAEIATIVRWVDDGAVAGAPSEAPAVPSENHLETVSVTLDPGDAYTPSQEGDDYRCFFVDPKLAQDRFLTAYEVKPDQRSEVHHVVLYSVDSDVEAQTAKALDDAESGLGYTCFGASGTGAGRSLAVWTPGAAATRYPEGTGLRLRAGYPLIMQVHYSRAKLADRTTMDLTLADTVEKEAIITGTLDFDLNLPPGQASVEESAAIPMPPLDRPVTIYGAYPHMHRLGKSIDVHYDAGTSSTCLVRVPEYDFNWQRFYFYETPIDIQPPGGGYLRIGCTYDTRSVDVETHWGERTDDEMCIAALYATY